MEMNDEVKAKFAKRAEEVANGKADTYDTPISMVQEWVREAKRRAMKEREDWVVECLHHANLPVEQLNEALRWLGRAEGFSGETLEKLYQSQIKKFFEDYKVQILIHPEYPDMELFMVNNEVIGVWRNEVGLVVDQDKIKLSMQKWVKGVTEQ